MARASYIDPRIIALYERGITIASTLTDLGKGVRFGDVATQGNAERAVLETISANEDVLGGDLEELADERR